MIGGYFQFRPNFPGAQALKTSGAVMIAGLTFSICEAKRVRDMRKYPFWARTAQCIETIRFTAPGKILRDSPTRRGTPKKSEEKFGEAGVLGSKFCRTAMTGRQKTD